MYRGFSNTESCRMACASGSDLYWRFKTVAQVCSPCQLGPSPVPSGCHQRDRPVCFAFVFSHAFETEVSLWMGNRPLQARRNAILGVDAFRTPKLLDLSALAAETGSRARQPWNHPVAILQNNTMCKLPALLNLLSNGEECRPGFKASRCTTKRAQWLLQSPLSDEPHEKTMRPIA